MRSANDAAQIGVAAIRVKARPNGIYVEFDHSVPSRVAKLENASTLLGMTPDDITKLILRTSMRERAAFDLLYRHTNAKLFGVCLRVLRDRAEAEEALQEVFVKVWTKADRFVASDLSPISWLVAIARNHCIDRLRSRKMRTTDLDEAAEIADPAANPEQAALAGSIRDSVMRCLSELEADRAAAVRCAYLDGESYADLAARFAVPLNTMKTWLRRSLMKLRECLER